MSHIRRHELRPSRDSRTLEDDPMIPNIDSPRARALYRSALILAFGLVFGLSGGRQSALGIAERQRTAAGQRGKSGEPNRPRRQQQKQKLE
jgi:hypothetical protein